MTRKEALLKAARGEITWIAAAEICRLTGRQMRRVRERFERLGEAGLEDKRRKPSPRRTPNERRQLIVKLYQDRYRDFSVIHFYEKLQSEHQVFGISYGTVLRILKDQGLVMKGEKRSAHRKRRDRRAVRGMMVHLDGSTHDWFGTGTNVDLVATLDDADSRVLSARFTPQESTRSCMEVIKETVVKYGVFCSLYTDRAMHFVITNVKGKKPDRNRVSQIERALDRLGTELIIAYSPQARGRMERMWRTWQGRLPQELRIKNITTLDEANRYLQEVFIPWHNENLTIDPKERDSSAFIRPHSSVNLDLIFSVQNKRQVNADNTIQYKTRTLQIPDHPDLRGGFAGLNVTVHEHLDGTLSIVQGTYVLAHYDRDWCLIKSTKTPTRKAA